MCLSTKQVHKRGHTSISHSTDAKLKVSRKTDNSVVFYYFPLLLQPNAMTMHNSFIPSPFQFITY